jgi:hypothetical protein
LLEPHNLTKYLHATFYNFNWTIMLHDVDIFCCFYFVVVFFLFLFFFMPTIMIKTHIHMTHTIVECMEKSAAYL